MKTRKKTPKILILRTAGTNCDKETAFAFELAGGDPFLVHVNELLAASKKITDFQVMVLPGGFTYGDDIASGKILANELRFKLKEPIRKFLSSGKLILGICNGFQVLVKSGFLPAITEASRPKTLTADDSRPQATLISNDSGRFEDRWVHLKIKSRCVWTKNLPEMIYLPVAHAEGKFIPQDEGILRKLWANGQVVMQYTNEFGRPEGYPSCPNGSIDNIAGICDPTGRVFGLMPHPERHLFFEQHPCWDRNPQGGFLKIEPPGLQIFRNAVEYAKNNL